MNKNVSRHLLPTGTSIREALVRLEELSLDAILFIVDHDNNLLGSLTDGDVRRGLIGGIGIDHKVDDIIQPHPKYIRKGDGDIKKVIDYRNKNFRIIPVL